MTHRLITNYAKNYYNRTLIVKVIVENVVTCFFGTRCIVTGTRRCGHITPALRQLHWLSVRQRIQYKLASLAFPALSGLAPDYLAGDCQLVALSGRRPLRSAERRVCHVPR